MRGPLSAVGLLAATFLLSWTVGGCGKPDDLTFLAEGTGHTSPHLPETYEGLPLDRWIARIDGGSPSDRATALLALAELPGAEAHVERIAKRLDDESPRVRWAALEVIGRIGGGSGGQVDAVLGRLRDPEPGVRRAAAVCAGRLGEAAAVPLVTRLLSPADEDIRDATKAALLGLGPEAAPALPQLTKAARDEDDVVLAEHAVDVLASIGEAAVPALRGLLVPAGTLASVTAASALGRLGPVAAPAIPDLLALAVGRKGDGRRSALEALASIGAAAVEPVEAARAAVPVEDEDLRAELDALLQRLRRP